MTQKELRKLSSKRLLELLAEQTGNANRLEQENELLKKRIANREQHLAKLGELAKTILHRTDAAVPAAERSRPAAAQTSSKPPEPRDSAGEPHGGADRDEYRIYKVFHATVSGSGISYTLVDGKTDVPEGSHFSLKNGYVVHDGVTHEDGRLTDGDIKAVAAYVAGDRPYKTVPITSEGSEAISVEPGYYYITNASGSVTMVVSTNPDAEAPEEAEAPVVTMAVTDGGTGRKADRDGGIMIQAGAAARFEAMIDVKKGALHYQLINTVDKRLRRGEGRIAVYTAGGDGRRSALDPQYWSHSWDAAADPGSDILTVAFYEDDSHKGAVPKDAVRIIVAYDAVVGGGLLDGAANSARVRYGANDTPDSTVRIYNAKVTVSNVAEMEQDGRKTLAPLAGASFMIGKNPAAGGGYEHYYVYDQEAGTVRWTDMLSDASVAAANAGADENQAEFTGLEAGTYYVVEKDVPAGYNKADDLEIEIQEGGYGPDNLARKADVVNKAGTRLPSTGGAPIPTAGGGFQLTLGSTALFITKKRGKDG